MDTLQFWVLESIDKCIQTLETQERGTLKKRKTVKYSLNLGLPRTKLSENPSKIMFFLFLLLK